MQKKHQFSMVNFLSDVENYFGSILSLVSIQLIWIITAFSEVPNDEKFKLVVGFIIISICGAIMTILICCKDKMNGPNKEIYLVIIFFMASLISVQLVQRSDQEFAYLNKIQFIVHGYTVFMLKNIELKERKFLQFIMMIVILSIQIIKYYTEIVSVLLLGIFYLDSQLYQLTLLIYKHVQSKYKNELSIQLPQLREIKKEIGQTNMFMESPNIYQNNISINANIQQTPSDQSNENRGLQIKKNNDDSSNGGKFRRSMSSYIKKDNDKLGQLGNTLYKIMFSSFQDGVAIINLNNKLQCFNKSMKKIISSKQSNGIKNKLFCLININEELKEEKKLMNLFDLSGNESMYANDPVSIMELNQSQNQLQENQMKKSKKKISLHNLSNASKKQSFDESLAEELGEEDVDIQFSCSDTLEQEVNCLTGQIIGILKSKIHTYKQQTPDIQKVPSHITDQVEDEGIECLCERIMYTKIVNLYNTQKSKQSSVGASKISKVSKTAAGGLDSSKITTVEKLVSLHLRAYIMNDTGFIILVARDVTHFNEIKSLQEINQNKSKILSQVAHEFRTPIHCITNSVSAAMDSINDEQIKDMFLEPAFCSANSLLSLVNDILDASLVNAGKFYLKLQEFDIREVLRKVEKMMGFQIKRKGLKLITIIDEFKISNKIKSDPQRIEQVLINLVGNSLKFTQQGSITINVTSLENQKLQILVRDTGRGIKEQDKSKLGKEFNKLDDTKDINPNGVGLGLVISNMLARKLSEKDEKGQALELFSNGENQGTTFCFCVYNHNKDEIHSQSSGMMEIGNTFPKVDSVITAYKKPGFYFTSINQCQCAKILVVDDEIFNIQVFEICLPSRNIQFDSAYSGEQAIEMVKRRYSSCGQCKQYCLIFMDVSLPGMNGFDAADEIMTFNNKMKLEKSQIYICSAYLRNATIIEACQKIGVQDYIEKPFKKSLLHNIINKLI